MIKSVAGRAGEHCTLQAGLPRFWLCRQHRFPRGCAAVSQLINSALALFFLRTLPQSPVRAFCFPPSPVMLSQLFVPVLLAPHRHSLRSSSSAQIPWPPLQEEPKQLQGLSAGQNSWWFVRIREILVPKQMRNPMEGHRTKAGPSQSYPRVLSQKGERPRVIQDIPVPPLLRAAPDALQSHDWEFSEMRKSRRKTTFKVTKHALPSRFEASMELQIWDFTRQFQWSQTKQKARHANWQSQAGWILAGVSFLYPAWTAPLPTPFHTFPHSSQAKQEGSHTTTRWAMPWACLSILLHPCSISQPLQQHHCSSCLFPAFSLPSKCSLAPWKSTGMDLLLREHCTAWF